MRSLGLHIHRMEGREPSLSVELLRSLTPSERPVKLRHARLRHQNANLLFSPFPLPRPNTTTKTINVACYRWRSLYLAQSARARLAHGKTAHAALQLKPARSWRRFSKHDQIGEVKIPLNTIDLAQTIEEWRPLTKVESDNDQVSLVVRTAD